MRRIPAVTSRVVIGKRGGLALERRVSGAQHGLSHVGDTVDHMPVVILWNFMPGRQARVGLGDGELA